jgi:dTDP-4-dehydrorhamnose 3,5-epimerase-like enzyme
VGGVIFRETALEGAFVIELERIEDERGYFARMSAGGSSASTA